MPTWNYTVVHAYGIPKKIAEEQLAKDLEKLVDHHESVLSDSPNVSASPSLKKN